MMTGRKVVWELGDQPLFPSTSGDSIIEKAIATLVGSHIHSSAGNDSCVSP